MSHETVKDKREAVSCAPELVNFVQLAAKSVGNLVFLRLFALKRRFFFAQMRVFVRHVA